MITGIGNDIVDISRIDGILKKHPDSFAEKIFTDDELAEAADKNHSPQYYAGRWAVKEAVSKALGCGIGAQCNWLDINTTNDEHGCPHTQLSGTAADTAAKRGANTVHVTITHDMNIAFAVAILEKS